MFDIIHDIWKNPGASFSPMPFWFWNDRLDKDKLVSQVDAFHKKGIDGFVIHPRLGMGGDAYMSDEYFDCVEAVLEAAKKRFMLVILYDEGMYPSGSAHGEVVKEEPRYAARRLYARVSEDGIPEGEDLLYRVFVNDKGDIAFDSKEGYTSYDFILGYTGGTIRGLSPDEDDGCPNAPKAADILNPDAVASYISRTHERYYARLSPYFGQTVIGFFTDEPSVTGRCAKMDGGIAWTYDLIDDFSEVGGDFTHLAALLLGSEDKRIMRDAEYFYRKAISRRLGTAFYGSLSKWCLTHGIALTGHPAESTDCDSEKYFDIPGQDIVWRMVEPGTELTSPDSPAPKIAADMARHCGISRSLNECFGVCGESGNPWNFKPDEMMRLLNFLFARGTSLIIPHAFYYSLETPLQTNERPPDVGMASVWWKDYRRLAGYIKRMSWLGATGTNNPVCAVLCSPECVPVKTVAPLYENGYTFNYLSVSDFMEKAHIHEGKIRIDRYTYDTLLIDGRLRLDSDITEKTEHFVAEGGHLYRGNDFIGFIKKHIKLTSYFEGETHGTLRLVHYTKSGCPFFLLVNEGSEDIKGNLVTDIPSAAEYFDPFTGKTKEAFCSMHENGFAYRVTVPAGCVLVLGMDPGSLPRIGEAKQDTVTEIIAEPLGRFTLSADLSGGRKYILRAESVCDRGDVSVNGEDAGSLLFRPYELDITSQLHDGDNEIEITAVPSPANRYGKPVYTGVDGVTVRITC